MNALNLVTVSQLWSMVNPNPLQCYAIKQVSTLIETKGTKKCFQMRNYGRDRTDESRCQKTRQAKIKTFKKGCTGLHVNSVSLERALLSPIRRERGRRSAASAVFWFLFSMENAASSKKFHHILWSLL